MASSGYCSPGYAESLAEFGTRRRLPQSEGWLLERVIKYVPYRDAMGCYPFFSCTDWSGLKADMENLQGDVVCVSMVVDPFTPLTETDLKDCFGARVSRFKDHYVADLTLRTEEFVSKHHQYYAKRARQKLEVERCAHPWDHLDEWNSLYLHLVNRRRLTGITAFSRPAFALQLQLPDLIMLRAKEDGQTVGAHLWLRHDNVVHSHLAASSPRGYELMAPYALYSAALEMFSQEARWLNFGASAGVAGKQGEGLASFKKGWSNATRTAYFCGRILDHDKYGRALAAAGAHDDGYFPAYRSGEFS